VKRRRGWLALAILLVAFSFLGTSCQWLQNEFFTLDRARPQPQHE